VKPFKIFEMIYDHFCLPNNRHGGLIFAKIIGKSEECAIINRAEDGSRKNEIGFVE
jgi:hypothetical protein